MDGYRRQQTVDRDLQVNQSITEDALDDLIYRPRFTCRALEPTAGAAGPVFGNTNSHEYLGYAAGANLAARLSWPIPTAYWINGTVTLRIIWAGDTVSANPVQWQFHMSPTIVGAAPVNLAVTAANMPAVTVVNALMDYTFATTVNAVNSSHISTGLNIQRNGAIDTYPGIAKLFDFQLLYRPAAGH